MDEQTGRNGCLSALVYCAIYFFGFWLLDCVIYRDAQFIDSPDYSWERSMEAAHAQQTYVWVAPIVLYLWHRFTATPTRSNSTPVNRTTNRSRTPANRTTNPTRSLEVLYRQEDELMKSCFDQRSCEFDWERYFNNRDAIIHCGMPEIVEQVRRDMIHYGELQVTEIITVLSQHRNEPQRLIQALRSMESNIIRNLNVMAGGGDEERCPAGIRAFRTRLYDLIYGRVAYSEEYVENLIELGTRCY